MAAPLDPFAASTSAHGLASGPPEEHEAELALRVADLVAERLAGEEAAQAAVSEQLLNLHEIGLALSSERDIDALLWLILSKARELTDADAASLYILDHPESHSYSEPITLGRTPDGQDPRAHGTPRPGEKVLYFRLSQNDSVALPAAMKRFPVGGSTLAGYAAATGRTLLCEDAYHIAASEPYKFNPRWDRDNGYRTRSVLVVPMKNRDGEVTGVLQLINRKRLQVPLSSPEDFERLVVPFDSELARLAEVVDSHAAVAIESNRLLSEVTRLLLVSETAFDSFVRAAAQLIDDRDPPTAGHSQRVTRMTLALALAASDEPDGPFAAARYSEREVQELRYATLLHDVGKIGVRESIFSKSHKIEPTSFSSILHRIARYQAERRAHAQTAVLNFWKTLPRDAAGREEAATLQVLEAEMASLDADRALVQQANEPTGVSDEVFLRQQAAIARLRNLGFESEHGPQVLVGAEEARSLSVRRGSLSEDERQQMEAHAQMSFEFLEQVAWAPHLASIPALAYCHHEKLDGSGYPRGILAPSIPMLGRMMTVADIYDALVAADRPYKRAMPRERALEILQDEAQRGMLDADVVELFLRHKVWEKA